MIDEAKMLTLLKQARTALKTNQPDIALARVRAAVRMIEPIPPQEPPPTGLAVHPWKFAARSAGTRT